MKNIKNFNQFNESKSGKQTELKFENKITESILSNVKDILKSKFSLKNMIKFPSFRKMYMYAKNLNTKNIDDIINDLNEKFNLNCDHNEVRSIYGKIPDANESVWTEHNGDPELRGQPENRKKKLSQSAWTEHNVDPELREQPDTSGSSDGGLFSTNKYSGAPNPFGCMVAVGVGVVILIIMFFLSCQMNGCGDDYGNYDNYNTQYNNQHYYHGNNTPDNTNYGRGYRKKRRY